MQLQWRHKYFQVYKEFMCIRKHRKLFVRLQIYLKKKEDNLTFFLELLHWSKTINSLGQSMTMFFSYSSLTLQLLQIKKQQQKNQLLTSLFHTHLFALCSTLSPCRQTREEANRKCAPKSILWHYTRRVPEKTKIPSHKANTSDFNQDKERIIQIHGHGEKLLSKPTLFHLFGLLINSKHCFYASCIMPKIGAFLKGLGHMQHVQCAILFS